MSTIRLVNLQHSPAFFFFHVQVSVIYYIFKVNTLLTSHFTG